MLSTIQNIARAVSAKLGRESAVIWQLRPLYENTLSLIGGRDGVPWDINGVTFQIDPHQRQRIGHDYEALVARFLHQAVKPGDVCFDVGANVGAYALQRVHWTGSAGRVIAFEPNPGGSSFGADPDE